MGMSREEASVLRNMIIQNFQSSPRLHELTDKLKVKTIEEWALSVEEVMALDPSKPEQFYMNQIEKIALMLGCSPKDSMEIAVASYADMVKQGEC